MEQLKQQLQAAGILYKENEPLSHTALSALAARPTCL